METQSYKVTEEKGCSLYSTYNENGTVTWDMFSQVTGSHSVITNGWDERVQNHWIGFISNQPN